MNYRDRVFVNTATKIDPSADVIFVADLFVEDYVGGAELTSEAIISESPLKVQKIRSQDVQLGTLQQGVSKYWVFGNFSQLNPELIPSIVANLSYSVLEYDYKFCKYRSPEKHAAETGQQCDCDRNMSGKIISAFYYGAKSLWWMSEAQKNRYTSMFPFLLERDNFVLSSVFDKKTLGTLKFLRDQVQTSQYARKGWVVLGSNSWVKGAEAAKKWCEDNGKEYEVVWGVSYDEMLDKLAHAEGFVYLPAGADTCPRMVIEAKLLGCNLHLNDFVQHKDEEWFNGTIDDIHDYLYASPALFWKAIASTINKVPTISGYTTTYNCISQKYPFEQCIRSMLQFANEVCVVDGGSTDGTWERLLELASENPSIKPKQVIRDWNHPRFAVFDGMQKAEARRMCTGDFCWQMDSDEIVHEDDAPKVVDLCKKIPKNVNVVSLPVIEYWGGPQKVRMDIQPWKWRLSRNLPGITHGIPVSFRRTDEDGNLYATPGTDGCDMIDATTGHPLHHVSFHTQETEQLRIVAVNGNKEAQEKYQTWFNAVIQNLPGVHHYSWYDIPRKMRTYRGYWTKHWNSLFDGSLEDTAETNMMFDAAWKDVSEEMIDRRAEELKSGTGGWIWHRKWDGSRVPHITCGRSEPALMRSIP